MSSDNPSDVHNINNVSGGDVIQQYGSGNVGKQVHTGSGDNVAGHKNPFESGFPMPATVIVNDGDYVAQDKTATHFGNVSHNLGPSPITGPGVSLHPRQPAQGGPAAGQRDLGDA